MAIVSAMTRRLFDGDAWVGGRSMHDEGRAGLVRMADREPANPALADVVADLEAEGVAVAGQAAAASVCGREPESMVMSMPLTLVAARTLVLLDS